MALQHILIFIIVAIVLVTGYETNITNATTNATNITGRNLPNGKSNVGVTTNVITCFSGDSQVELINGTWKTIGELQAGDLVYSYDGTQVISAEMIMMLDQQSSIDAKFHTLKTESGHTVSLTSLHLIATVSSSGTLVYKPAKDVQVGDQLFVLLNNNLVSSSIIQITLEVKRGYFSPLTTKGALFVDGVLSSCFSNVKSHDAAQFYMSPLKWYYYTARFLSMNDPFGTSSTDGVHWVPKIMFAFGQQFRPSTLLV